MGRDEVRGGLGWAVCMEQRREGRAVMGRRRGEEAKWAVRRRVRRRGAATAREEHREDHALHEERDAARDEGEHVVLPEAAAAQEGAHHCERGGGRPPREARGGRACAAPAGRSGRTGSRSACCACACRAASAPTAACAGAACACRVSRRRREGGKDVADQMGPKAGRRSAACGSASGRGVQESMRRTTLSS